MMHTADEHDDDDDEPRRVIASITARSPTPAPGRTTLSLAEFAAWQEREHERMFAELRRQVDAFIAGRLAQFERDVSGEPQH